jgi:8-oxo-dGTP diphosphatase
MKLLLLTIRESDIENNATQPNNEYRERFASRGVLLDENNQVYLLNVSKHGYHKLPGGGIDDGEDKETAFYRELLEEVGCNAEIIAELGEIVEYRNYDDIGLKQTSYCYLARQKGEQQQSDLEQGELDLGMFELKAKNIDEAISLLENDKPESTEGKFIQKRDLHILKTAKTHL